MKLQEESAQFMYDDAGNLIAMYKQNGTLTLYLVKEAHSQDLKELFDQKQA